MSFILVYSIPIGLRPRDPLPFVNQNLWAKYAAALVGIIEVSQNNILLKLKGNLAQFKSNVY